MNITSRFPKLLSLLIPVVLLIIILMNGEFLWSTLLQIQRQANHSIAMLIKSLESASFFSTKAAMLFLISLTYGIFHAIGPGHGKAVLCTSMLNNKKNFPSVLKSTLIAALTHIISAVLLTTIIILILKGLNHFAQMNLNSNLMKVNGYIIALLGITCFITFFSGKTDFLQRLSQDDKTIGIIAGMIPCPATTTILMLSISHNILWAGALSTFGIVLGIFITLLVPCLLIIIFRDQLLHFILRGKQNKKIFLKPILLLQGVFFIAMGLIWII